jgi:hypothetical protein
MNEWVDEWVGEWMDAKGANVKGLAYNNINALGEQLA